MPPLRRRRCLVPAMLVGLAVFIASDLRAADTLGAIDRIDRIGRTIAAEKCERPLEVKVSVVRNPHAADVADEMESIACRGWRIAVYRSFSTRPPRELPMSVVVEAGHARVGAAWSVGTTPAQVQAALGAPTATRGESFGYSLSPERPGRDVLDFEVRAGIVRAITWTWDVD